jgi:hypothetical protein
MGVVPAHLGAGLQAVVRVAALAGAEAGGTASSTVS